MSEDVKRCRDCANFRRVVSRYRRRFDGWIDSKEIMQEARLVRELPHPAYCASQGELNKPQSISAEGNDRELDE